MNEQTDTDSTTAILPESTPPVDDYGTAGADVNNNGIVPASAEDSQILEQEEQAMNEILAEENQSGNDREPNSNETPAPEETAKATPSEDSVEDSPKNEADSDPGRTDEVERIQDEIDNFEGPKQDPQLRLLKTQMAYHKKGQELSQQVKANEDLQKQITDLKSLVGEYKSQIDNKDDIPKEIYEKLPEKTKELLEETPGLRELVSALLPTDPQSVAEEVVDKKFAARDEQSKSDEAERILIAKQDAWVEGVLKAYPDYFEIEKSPGFKRWCNEHQATVDAILDPYDDYDPKGGIVLRKAFDTYRESILQKKANTDKANTAASTHIDGLSAQTPAPSKPVPKTREQIEDEAMEEILSGKF